jgi:tRNA modification GTPase
MGELGRRNEEYMFENDTIAAISTAHGTGGIGIIRISGDNAFKIAERIFSGKKPFYQIKTHTINYGKIIEPVNGEIIDEVLLSKMVKPNTFTREDIVEVNCHGGIIVLKNILSLIVREGARLAEPGEFTKRAFLNGRLDLSQAEAVIDLINAKTIEGSKAAINQLEGRLSVELKAVRKKLIELIAHIEVTVDYPEHDIEEITGQKVYSEIKNIKEILEGIIRGFEKGRIIREGISVVIVGRPNVGKSSLLNELSGKTKAIVTDIPGTTRDIIEEYINLNGIPVRLTDTAGIRETSDPVEKIGVEKAETALSEADLILLVFDASQGLIEEDLELLKRIGNKKSIILINKIDLVNEEEIIQIEKALVGQTLIKTSIKKNIGINELETKITELFLKGEIDLNNEFLITNIRHKHLIDKAIGSIEEACIAHENQMPLDCITIDIKNTAEHIGEITGETVSEDVMKEIFNKFCIGK